MLTFDGEYFGPLTDSAPSLEAIAMGLGRRPRFAGQTSKPFNVLAHSFLVYELMDEADEHRFDALLHDAPEAVVGDMPSPWKTDDDRRREVAILMRIYRQLGRWWTDWLVSYEAIKRADHLALRLEHTLLMPRRTDKIKPVTQFGPDFFHIPTAEYWITQAQKREDWIYPDSIWVRHFCDLLRQEKTPPQPSPDA